MLKNKIYTLKNKDVDNLYKLKDEYIELYMYNSCITKDTEILDIETVKSAINDYNNKKCRIEEEKLTDINAYFFHADRLCSNKEYGYVFQNVYINSDGYVITKVRNKYKVLKPIYRTDRTYPKYQFKTNDKLLHLDMHVVSALSFQKVLPFDIKKIHLRTFGHYCEVHHLVGALMPIKHMLPDGKWYKELSLEELKIVALRDKRNIEANHFSKLIIVKEEYHMNVLHNMSNISVLCIDGKWHNVSQRYLFGMFNTFWDGKHLDTFFKIVYERMKSGQKEIPLKCKKIFIPTPNGKQKFQFRFMVKNNRESKKFK